MLNCRGVREVSMDFNSIVGTLACAVLLGVMLAQPADAESARSSASPIKSKGYIFSSFCRQTQVTGPNFILLSQPTGRLSGTNMDMECMRRRAVEFWLPDQLILPNPPGPEVPTFCTIIPADGRLVRACTKG